MLHELCERSVVLRTTDNILEHAFAEKCDYVASLYSSCADCLAITFEWLFATIGSYAIRTSHEYGESSRASNETNTTGTYHGTTAK